MNLSKIGAGTAAILFSVFNFIPGDELVLGPIGAGLIINGIADEEVVDN